LSILSAEAATVCAAALIVGRLETMDEQKGDLLLESKPSFFALVLMLELG
jgi:hypothetical protein